MAVQYCGCSSEFQDSRYGKGMRVMNLMQGKKDDKVRCTVCGREHAFKGAEKKILAKPEEKTIKPEEKSEVKKTVRSEEKKDSKKIVKPVEKKDNKKVGDRNRPK